MGPQTPPNRWSCLPTAFSIALGIPLKDIIGSIGHDGSEIIWNYLPEPFCRRSFHIQELCYMCWRKGIHVSEYEALPKMAPDGGSPISIDCKSDLELILQMNTSWGVLTGIGDRGLPHAVAWNGFTQTAYDNMAWSKERLATWFHIEAFFKFGRSGSV